MATEVSALDINSLPPKQGYIKIILFISPEMVYLLGFPLISIRSPLVRVKDKIFVDLPYWVEDWSGDPRDVGVGLIIVATGGIYHIFNIRDALCKPEKCKPLQEYQKLFETSGYFVETREKAVSLLKQIIKEKMGKGAMTGQQ